MIGDIEVEVLETLKNGVQEFSKKLAKEASMYGDFREDLAKIVIALSTDKYRIRNPQELKGLKKDDIDTILFTYNCFGSLKAIIRTKNGQNRILEIEIFEDEEARKLVELMKVQHDTLMSRFEKEKEELEKEIERKEKEYTEFKNFMIEIMIEEDMIHYLQDIIFFYGGLEDIKDALEIAKVKGKDIKKIAEKIADIYDPEGVLYVLYKVDKEAAKELANELGIDFEKFKREFEIEA